MNFYDTMLKKLGKKKTEKITKAIKDCLKGYINTEGGSKYINDPDYCNAFGIMQGVAYALGYDWCAITTDKDMPGFWFDNLIKEMENELAVYHKNVETFIESNRL